MIDHEPILLTRAEAIKEADRSGLCVVNWGTTGYFVVMQHEKAVHLSKHLNCEIVYVPKVN